MPAEITDSDLMGLVEQRRLVRRVWWRKWESTALLLSLFLCGYGAGYVHSDWLAARQMLDLRVGHQNQIDQLQASQTISITTASETAKDAAATAAGAAARVNAAAEKVERATAPKGKP